MKEKNHKILPRHPIVVVLGHVDHGKTTILDFIRKTKIAEKEAGGITQHIGAYEINYQGKKITFIDTPGHEAFSAMRSRGAKVADIAILVVAADEGVKPQTKEAIEHIKKWGLSFLVALNKIDKPQSQPQKVKNELAKEGVIVEELGGDVPCVEVSGKTGQGIDNLLEMILLLGEMAQLKGDISSPAQGVVIEAYLDEKRGPTATLLVRDGVLKEGEIIATRSTFGKIKRIESFQGERLKEVFPSSPCVVIGFEEVPQVGEKFKVFKTQEEAFQYIEKKEKKEEERREVLYLEKGKKVLNLILKADVKGSLEAIENVLKSLPQEKVVLRVLKSEVGEVSERDIQLALTSKAKILNFRTKLKKPIQVLAERRGVVIQSFDVIYDLAQKVRVLMEEVLGEEKVKKELGKLEVLAVFKTEKPRQIIGGRVIEGEIEKGAMVNVLRKEEIVGKGKIINLQKDKRDVEKVKEGNECGILYEGDVKIKEGDILEIYIYQKIKPTI